MSKWLPTPSLQSSGVLRMIRFQQATVMARLSLQPTMCALTQQPQVQQQLAQQLLDPAIKGMHPLYQLLKRMKGIRPPCDCYLGMCGLHAPFLCLAYFKNQPLQVSVHL